MTARHAVPRRPFTRRLPRRLGTAVLATVLAVLALTSSTTASAACANLYGSGCPGPWQTYGHSLSSDTQFAAVVARGDVVMVGDSIARVVQRDFAERLYAASGQLLAVDTWDGRPTAPTVDALAVIKAEHGLPPDIVVVAGANDIYDPSRFAADIDELMALVGPTRTVYWTEVQAVRGYKDADTQRADQRNSGWLSGQLWEATQRHPNLHVWAWGRFLQASPGWRYPTYTDGTVAGTGAHPEGSGIGAFNAGLLETMGVL